MKTKCENCGRESDVVNMKNCPFCSQNEPKQINYLQTEKNDFETYKQEQLKDQSIVVGYT
jgi:hypothetical protein